MVPKPRPALGVGIIGIIGIGATAGPRGHDNFFGGHHFTNSLRKVRTPLGKACLEKKQGKPKRKQEKIKKASENINYFKGNPKKTKQNKDFRSRDLGFLENVG